MKRSSCFFRFTALYLGVTMCLYGCGDVNNKVDSNDSIQENIGDESLSADVPSTSADTESADALPQGDIHPLNVSTYDIYENYYDDNAALMVAECSAGGITIHDEGYDSLKKSLSEFTGNAEKDAMEFSQTARESFAEYGSDIVDMGLWTYECPIRIRRADSQLVSFFTVCSSYMGGAHPNSYQQGYTYDSTTGKRMELRDIAEDYDGLLNTVIELAKDYPYADEYFEDWQDTISNSFNPKSEMDGSVNWAVTSDKLQIIYNAYDLGPYAMGAVCFDIPYSDYPQLLNSEYFSYNPGSVYYPDIEYGNDYKEFDIDIDKDGAKEYITISAEEQYSDDYNPETDYEHSYEYEIGSLITIGYGRSMDAAASSTQELYAEIALKDAYVLENENNQSYLYLTVMGFSDYEELHVYDLNNPDTGVIEIGNASNAFYGFVPTDSRHFYLAGRVNVMGTYSGFRMCHVGDDGQPVWDDDYYTIDYWDEPVKMTLLQDVDTIKAGTELTPYKSDDVDTMIFKLNNGETIELKYDTPEWPRTINGIDEEELFDRIMYAG